ncbi:MAG TPA: ATP-dependent metallopeptidase FtsH/Yme1/Tma family protein [Candidatus Sulfotelmatobacter sp.]|nr:ATP-dependent metallopeptidase FtsH/Yme1/Tma family protein [Candidatus Sulfotelmatobacter sp.]
MNRTIRTILFWGIVAIAAVLLWQVVRSTPQDRMGSEISYSRFISEVQSGNVATVTINGMEIRGRYREGNGMFHLNGPSDPRIFLETLQSKNVEILFRDTQSNSLPMSLLATWAPLILLGGLWFYMIRVLQRRKPPPGGVAPGPGC